MRVLTLINGSLLSEAASHYAVAYAAEVELPLTALFVDNRRESVEQADKSAKVLARMCATLDVPFEYIQLEGAVISQLEHYCQLYAVDTLFCATRRQSSARSFSEKIVAADLETDVAVVKVKNLSNLDAAQRVMLVADERINPHTYVLWLGLIKRLKAQGLIYLSEHSTYLRANSKSGLKYQAAPFMQIAKLSGCPQESIEVINAPHAMTVDQMLQFQVEEPIDLVIYSEGAYSQRNLNRLSDHSSVNSILFYPWMN